MAEERADHKVNEEEDGGGAVKSFLEHLEDLRWTLIKGGSALMIAMVLCLVAGNYLARILEWPLVRSKAPIRLDYLDPAAPFLSALHLAFFGGMLLAAPFLFYFVFQFVLPALKIKEKKYLRIAIGFGTGLFLMGVSVCYFVVAPLALRAAVQYSNWLLGQAVTSEVKMWRADTYFGFMSKFMLGMGLGFELPVVLLTLVKLGVLDYAKLAAMRRYMIVICLLLGALLTTPEVLTQVVMAVPLYALYEMSVAIAWYWERQEKKREAALAALAGKADHEALARLCLVVLNTNEFLYID
jgi:sec-independent protein translocase protein TatC